LRPKGLAGMAARLETGKLWGEGEKKKGGKKKGSSEPTQKEVPIKRKTLLSAKAPTRGGVKRYSGS